MGEKKIKKLGIISTIVGGISVGIPIIQFATGINSLPEAFDRNDIDTALTDTSVLSEMNTVDNDDMTVANDNNINQETEETDTLEIIYSDQDNQSEVEVISSDNKLNTTESVVFDTNDELYWAYSDNKDFVSASDLSQDLCDKNLRTYLNKHIVLYANIESSVQEYDGYEYFDLLDVHGKTDKSLYYDPIHLVQEGVNNPITKDNYLDYSYSYVFEGEIRLDTNKYNTQEFNFYVTYIARSREQ